MWNKIINQSHLNNKIKKLILNNYHPDRDPKICLLGSAYGSYLDLKTLDIESFNQNIKNLILIRIRGKTNIYKH